MFYERKILKYKYILTVANPLLIAWVIYYFLFVFTMQDLPYFLVGYIFLRITNSMFVHRKWSHHAWSTKYQFIELFGLVQHTLMWVGPSIAWVSIHRRHHKYVDTPKDPHSPYYKSRWKIQFVNFDTPNDIKYAIDLIKSPLHRWFTNYYFEFNILFLILLGCFSTHALGIWLAEVGTAITIVHSTNAFLHKTPKFLLPIKYSGGSANSFLMNLIHFNGEAWHNNHHQDQFNWNFGKKWYEFDMTAWVLLGLSKLKLIELR